MTLAEAARRRNETRRNRTGQVPRGAASAKAPLFGWPLLLGILGVAILLAVSLLTGVYDVFGGDGGAEMFQITRIPRTIALVLAGAAMAMCGLVMQLLTQNRFVEPTTTGTTEWAGLGLMLTVIIYPTPRSWHAWSGDHPHRHPRLLRLPPPRLLKSSLIVPIVGIMLGAVVGAVSTSSRCRRTSLQSLGIWFAGLHLDPARPVRDPVDRRGCRRRIFISPTASPSRSRQGDRHQRRTQLQPDPLLGTVFVAIATGVVTVVVGNLPFLGLIVPNIVSLMRGDDLRSNLRGVSARHAMSPSATSSAGSSSCPSKCPSPHPRCRRRGRVRRPAPAPAKGRVSSDARKR